MTKPSEPMTPKKFEEMLDYRDCVYPEDTGTQIKMYNEMKDSYTLCYLRLQAAEIALNKIKIYANNSFKRYEDRLYEIKDILAVYDKDKGGNE